MPNSVSAKKRLRQNEKTRLRNRSVKSNLRTLIRKVREATAAGDIAKADEQFRIVAKKLDQAGAKKIIHVNRAGRLKSRLQHHIKGAKAAKAS